MITRELSIETAMLLERIGQLESLLRDRDASLQAIRDGDIDALVVSNVPGAYRLFTLESSERPYRFLVEQIPEGAVTLSQHGTILYCNPRFAIMLCSSEQQIIGQDFRTFLRQQDVTAFDGVLYEVANCSVRKEFALHLPHGDVLRVNVSLSLLPREGEMAVFCGIVTDVSQQADKIERITKANADLEHAADELERARDVADSASRAKSRFLADMSHELRTPLNGILGYAHLLHIEGGLNVVQAARVDAMLETGKHLLGIITCSLDLSEIEAEHVELHSAELDLCAIASACLDLVRPMAQAKGLDLSIAISHMTSSKLMADEFRLRQILLNLLGNAAKFTRQGAIEVRWRTSADGSALRIEVADTGPGISVGQRQHLFRDFERLDIEATGKVEGAGLGLALSARLATLMGGRLGHDDNPAGGSVFWLELPLDTVASSPPATASGPDVADTETAVVPNRTLQVLVVDDVLMNRDIAAAFLRSAGHAVLCVESGAEAVAAAGSTDFDVVLMDVRMPEMDGLEATRRIRALEGARGTVPIVALTAQAFTDQIAECRKAGMGSHLAKPFDPETLLAVVLRAGGANRYGRALLC